MENQDEQALNPQVGEETTLDATPAIENETTEETPIESSETAIPQEETVVETEQKPKKGANARIGELTGEIKSLKQRLQEVTSGNGAIPTPQPNSAIDLDSGEVTPEQYRLHVMQQASNLVDLKMKQSEAINRISNESAEVMRAYPQLDPESDQFDKELSETVSEAIEAQVKLNPYSASVKQFADRLMKPLMKAVQNGVAQEKETITRQVSESALRPTSIRKPEKTVGEMSIAELEAKLGIYQT
jgi:hypothetical protein